MPRARRIPNGVEPADVILGVEVYRCEPLSARISVTQCEANREIAGASARKRMHPKFITPTQRKHGVALKRGLSHPGEEWSRDVIRIRQEHCKGCPGVIALARAAAKMEASRAKR